MRVARGKVIGNTVVLLDRESLPEGSTVTVWVDEPGGFELDDACLDDLSAADLACERGEGLTVEELTVAPRSTPRSSRM